MAKSFAVIGHDGRQEAAAEYLRKAGYSVYKAESVHLTDYILLPMPLDADNIGLVQLLHAAKSGAVAFAGKISREAFSVAKNVGVEMIDYLTRDELSELNAIPTAEGAIEILMANRQKTLWNSAVTVIGFGRIAKLLCHRLSAFGARVTVAARSGKNLAEAQAMGYGAVKLSMLADAAGQADIIVNTVPALVLGEHQLSYIKKDAFVLDLASVPGGVDFAAAKRLGVRTRWALSLPAKTAPVTAGEFVAETVLLIIAERGDKTDE